MADMKGCDRDYIAHKTKNIDSLVLYRKEKKTLTMRFSYPQEPGDHPLRYQQFYIKDKHLIYNQLMPQGA